MFDKYLNLFDWSKLSSLSIIAYVWLGLIVFLILSFFFINLWFKYDSLSRIIKDDIVEK